MCMYVHVCVYVCIMCMDVYVCACMCMYVYGCVCMCVIRTADHSLCSVVFVSMLCSSSEERYSE